MPAKIVVDGDGKILMLGDNIAVTNADGECGDCCAAEEFCFGCSGTTDLTDLTLDIDATGATGNGGAVINGCDDADCIDVGGVYTISFTTGSISACGGLTFASEDICYWELPLSETSPTIPCVTNTFGDVIYLYFKCAIGQASDSDWYIVVNVIFSDDPATPAGPTYIWQQNLGSSKPTCDSVFPITLDDTDYCSPTGFGETVTATCYLSNGVSITVDIA